VNDQTLEKNQKGGENQQAGGFSSAELKRGQAPPRYHPKPRPLGTQSKGNRKHENDQGGKSQKKKKFKGGGLSWGKKRTTATASIRKNGRYKNFQKRNKRKILKIGEKNIRSTRTNQPKKKRKNTITPNRHKKDSPRVHRQKREKKSKIDERRNVRNEDPSKKGGKNSKWRTFFQTQKDQGHKEE